MASDPATSVDAEAELYAPDLDEGELDVEHYLLPDESTIADPYLREVWAEARKALAEGDTDSAPGEQPAALDMSLHYSNLVARHGAAGARAIREAAARLGKQP